MAPAGHRSAPRGWSRPGSGGTGTAPAGTQSGDPPLARPGPPREAPRRDGPAPQDGKERSGCEGAGLGREGSPALTQLASEQTPSTAPMAPPPASCFRPHPAASRGGARRALSGAAAAAAHWLSPRSETSVRQ